MVRHPRVLAGLLAGAVAVAALLLVGRALRAQERFSDAAIVRVADLGAAGQQDAQQLEVSWRERTRELNSRRAAAALTDWLDGLVGTSASPRRSPRDLDLDRVTDDVSTIESLLDDMPVADSTADAEVTKFDSSSGRLRVLGGVDVVLRASANPWRNHRLGVSATIEPASGDPSSDRISAWSVLRLDVNRGGLFHYRDPQVIVGTNTTLVADRRNLDLALGGFEFAQSHVAGLAARYRALDGPTKAALFYVSSPSQAADVLGLPSPSGSYIAFANGIGDVALLNGVAKSATWIDQVATIQHELTHVVTLPFTREAPQLFTEGVAVYEEHRTIVAEGDRYLVLDDLVEAFTNDEIDFHRLATEDESFRTNPDGAAVDYLVGGAVIHVLEELGGHDRVVAFYRRLTSGASTEAALQASYGFGIGELERRTRAWARANARWSG